MIWIGTIRMISSRKAVFFDRDGVLNKDAGYLYLYDQMEWVDGAREAIAMLTGKGYLIFVVTNQSGIARGYYKEEDVEKLHCLMECDIEKMGGHITEFFYCPHLKGASDSKYDIDCDCRKPKPGMILAAIKKYKIDPHNAFLVGDSQRDIEAAYSAGIKGFLFKKGNLELFVRNCLSLLKGS